jgi:Amt family ammonium transporter
LYTTYTKAEIDDMVLIANKSIDVIWMITSTIMILMMQLGFAMLETGSIRAKNTSNVLLKSVTDCIVGSISFYLCGYGLLNN